MKRKFLVKVGDKTFPVEVEELHEQAIDAAALRSATVDLRAVPPEITQRREIKEVEAVAGAIQSPLPGKVVSIKFGVGDKVKAGDTVLVLESMKMENTIMAPRSGKVKEIRVKEGANVALDDILFVIE